MTQESAVDISGRPHTSSQRDERCDELPRCDDRSVQYQETYQESEHRHDHVPDPFPSIQTSEEHENDQQRQYIRWERLGHEGQEKHRSCEEEALPIQEVEAYHQEQNLQVVEYHISGRGVDC